MTVTTLQAESAPAKPTEAETLYRAWRYAVAQWDLADNDPANPEGLSDEDRDRFADMQHDALMAYYLCPTTDLFEISRKLRTFKGAQGFQLNEAPAIIERLAEDVRHLAIATMGARRGN